jgi:hypothetical protein
MESKVNLFHSFLLSFEHWRRLLLSIVAMALLYANLSVIFSYPLEEFHVRPLPFESSCHDAFLIFGVFSYYETSNYELTIWGYATNFVEGKQYWKELPVKDYFPFAFGNSQTRLWASRQYSAPDPRDHSKAWRFMGKRILERYNRQHPTVPLTKIGFRYLTWPRSSDGFYAEESNATSSRQFWLVFEAAQN